MMRATIEWSHFFFIVFLTLGGGEEKTDLEKNNPMA